MVLFLRPTESSTVFIQQLGRGLRKYTGKDYVSVLDFIGNSYKRSVQIAFALCSLAENFIVEKRLMISLVQDNFTALGLLKYGVEINIDDLSKEEIINYIESENFNSLKYLKQDYFNFKKYINSEFAPLHMDYLNNDCAPDLLRFMSIKIEGKKNYSYYKFLNGIDEENLPVFNDHQISFINYLSEMLPLVRQHEYHIYKCVTNGTYVYGDIVYIFASIKKGAGIKEHLNYKDKFLQSDLFQWECEAGLNEHNRQELIDSKKAYLFIRKVESENGIVLPFTFVGTGKLKNPRSTENQKGSLLFDIHMHEKLPDYLQYDFGLTN